MPQAIIGVLIFASIGLLFVAGAIQSSKRLGRRGLAVAWCVSTLLITGVAVFRYRSNRIAMGGGSGWDPDVTRLPLFLVLAACAFGGATLVLLQRWRRAGGLSRSDVLAGLVGFVAGALLPVIVAFVGDFVRLMRGNS